MLNFEALYHTLRRQLHYAYLVYALPLVCITSLITPAFQSPDEPNHFARAEQVSRLEMVPVFVYEKLDKADSIRRDPRISYPDKGGFKVDKGIYELEHLYSVLARNNLTKVNSLKTDSAKNLHWGAGNTYFNFGNTAIYPPVVYVMQATGIGIGKLLHLNILNTLYLSRLLNGALSVAMCFFALLLAKRSNILMFIVLLFPMTISLFASVSQDAVLISCCFLLAGFIDNVAFADRVSVDNWKLYVMIALIAIIGIAKPPYILFVFLFLFLPLGHKQKAISIIVPFLVLAFWLIINHSSYGIKFAPAEMKLNSKLQVLYILHHPFKFMGMFFIYDKSVLVNMGHMFVGVLAWLDLPLSNIYYRNAYICLFLGTLISLGFNGNARLRMALLACSLVTLIAVISAQYVTWTALESPSLSGMQGRYLIPIFPFLALAISGYLVNSKFTGLKSVLLSAVLLFPVYTAVTLVYVILNRYY